MGRPEQGEEGYRVLWIAAVVWDALVCLYCESLKGLTASVILLFKPLLCVIFESID